MPYDYYSKLYNEKEINDAFNKGNKKEIKLVLLYMKKMAKQCFLKKKNKIGKLLMSNMLKLEEQIIILNLKK